MKAVEFNKHGNCSKCHPKPCDCHPCSGATVGDCHPMEKPCGCGKGGSCGCSKPTCATPVNCGVEYDNSGCENEQTTDCIFIGDITLTEYLETNIEYLATLIKGLAPVRKETWDGCIGDGYAYVSISGTIYNEDNPTGVELLVDEYDCPYKLVVELNFRDCNVCETCELNTYKEGDTYYAQILMEGEPVNAEFSITPAASVTTSPALVGYELTGGVTYFITGITEEGCVATKQICVPYDCENVNIGEPCNDGNDCTENDIIQPDCSCSGTPIAIDSSCASTTCVGKFCMDDCGNVIPGILEIPCPDPSTFPCGTNLDTNCQNCPSGNQPVCPDLSNFPCGEEVYDECGNLCGTGTGLGECPDPNTIPCNEPVTDNCGNDCGEIGTANCSDCPDGTNIGDSCQINGLEGTIDENCNCICTGCNYSYYSCDNPGTFELRIPFMPDDIADEGANFTINWFGYNNSNWRQLDEFVFCQGNNAPTSVQTLVTLLLEEQGADVSQVVIGSTVINGQDYLTYTYTGCEPLSICFAQTSYVVSGFVQNSQQCNGDTMFYNLPGQNDFYPDITDETGDTINGATVINDFQACSEVVATGETLTGIACTDGNKWYDQETGEEISYSDPCDLEIENSANRRASSNYEWINGKLVTKL